jgi:signal transduction histidine kinase
VTAVPALRPAFRPVRAYADLPIKLKVLLLVFAALALPVALCLVLVRANYGAVASFADDVELYAAVNRLKDANGATLARLEAFLRSGALDDLSDYNRGIDGFAADLAAAEAAPTDLETRFLLNSLRNSFDSRYEEAHAAIRARIAGEADPFAAYYRAQRIGRFMDGYLSTLVGRILTLGAATYRSALAKAAIARAVALAVLALVAGGGVILGLVLSEYLAVPIRRLSAAAARMAAGDLTVDPLPAAAADEAGQLTRSFNLMNAHIASLVADLEAKARLEKRLHAQELKNAANLKLLKESEFLALQARINPHFLFNALNSIARDVMLRGGRDAVNLVDSLSSLLRYGLDQGGGVSTLAAELEIVRKYAFIQSYRFSDRIAVEVDCRVERPAQVRLPAFSIQPLVENAFIHGLEPKVEGGAIRVLAERRGNSVVVTVSDDGVGIDAERLKAITRKRDAGGAGQLSSIGLANVRARLRLFTGDRRCFALRAAPGGGTVARIALREPPAGGPA